MESSFVHGGVQTRDDCETRSDVTIRIFGGSKPPPYDRGERFAKDSGVPSQRRGFCDNKDWRGMHNAFPAKFVSALFN